MKSKTAKDKKHHKTQKTKNIFLCSSNKIEILLWNNYQLIIQKIFLTMNTNSQRLTYDQAKRNIREEYSSIPYPQLCTLAKEAGFIQGRGGRCQATLVEFLRENKFSKEFRGITHTMKLPRFSTEWKKNSLDRNPFMDLFGDDGSHSGDGTERAKQFRKKNS